jgi:hypothetical protein
MNKIKLPRKRKKAYIKRFGAVSYFGVRITSEILAEENVKAANKFPKYKVVNGRFVVTGYW